MAKMPVVLTVLVRLLEQAAAYRQAALMAASPGKVPTKPWLLHRLQLRF
jgi:hypothetical protein